MQNIVADIAEERAGISSTFKKCTTFIALVIEAEQQPFSASHES